MIETYTYRDAFPADVLAKYTFLETRSASQILKHVCPNEFSDLLNVLQGFSLSARLLLTKGGNRGPIPTIIDGSFERLGWTEARVDMERRAFLFKGHNANQSAEDDPDSFQDNLVSRTYQRGYSIDNIKGRVALDIEWNPKDGNLDRDFSAYRAWHEEGLIDAAVLITRMHQETRELANEAWDLFVQSNPEYKHITQPVDYRTTTTANFEKGRDRIIRGDLGTCPILMIGIGKSTYDNVPWDGNAIKWDSAESNLFIRSAFNDSDAGKQFEWFVSRFDDTV